MEKVVVAKITNVGSSVLRPCRSVSGFKNEEIRPGGTYEGPIDQSVLDAWTKNGEVKLEAEPVPFEKEE